MAADNKPFIRFSHSKKLRTQTLKVLNAIDKAKDPVKFREPLAELVIDLTVAGLEQFFLESVRRLKMGFMMEQMAGLGTTSVLAVMSPLVRNLIGRMTAEQIREASKIIREKLD